MKVVLDTNVLLSGMFARGVCDVVLSGLLHGPDHQVCVSEAILKEFVEKAVEKFRAPPHRVQFAAAHLRQRMCIVVPVDVPLNACRDADDLCVLGTLSAAVGASLVTGDKDLLTIGQFRGAAIISPRRCLELMTLADAGPI